MPDTGSPPAGPTTVTSPMNDRERVVAVDTLRFLDRMVEDYLSDDREYLRRVPSASRHALRVPHLTLIGMWLRTVSLTFHEVRTRELAATPAAAQAVRDLLDHDTVPEWLLYASPAGHLMVGRVHTPVTGSFWRGAHSGLCCCGNGVVYTAADAEAIAAALRGDPHLSPTPPPDRRAAKGGG